MKEKRPEVYVSLGRQRHLLALIQDAAIALRLGNAEVVRRVLEVHLKKWCDANVPAPEDRSADSEPSAPRHDREQ